MHRQDGPSVPAVTSGFERTLSAAWAPNLSAGFVPMLCFIWLCIMVCREYHRTGTSVSPQWYDCTTAVKFFRYNVRHGLMAEEAPSNSPK